MRDNMWLSAWGFCEPSLIWLLPCRDVTSSICDCPEMISTTYISCPNVVGDGVAAVVSVWGFTTAGIVNSVILYIICLSRKQSAVSPHPGCVSFSSLICFSRKLTMRCCTILEIVPITQPGSSSLLSLPSSVSSASSSLCSPSASSSELAWSLRLSPTAFNISSNVVSDFVVVDRAFSTFLICSCFYIIAVSASCTRFLATAVSLSRKFSIHKSFSWLLKLHVSHHFSADSFVSDRTLRNARNAPTLSACKPLLPSFAWWCGHMDIVVNLTYLPTRSGESFIFGALTNVCCVDLVVGRYVGCCTIWTTWRQAASFMSRWVGFIKYNKAKSAFWPSLHWE